MDSNLFIQIAYLVASVLFIIDIKMLGKTATARKGNQLSAAAMLIAIVATLLDFRVLSFTEIFIAILIGSAIGAYFAQKVAMTKMPEMVALFNGVGGGASVFVAISEYYRVFDINHEVLDTTTGVTLVLSVIIGSVTFTGSYIAFAKLNGSIKGQAITFKGQHALNAVLFALLLIASAMMVNDPQDR